MGRAFERTEMLFGREAMYKLAGSRVAVFGVGGVGGFVVEGLARSGVGALDLVDHDIVDITNINRQIIATTDTVGECKVEAAARRIRSINPDCEVKTYQIFYLPETKDQFDFSEYDYVVDAVDTVKAKITLIEAAKEAGLRSSARWAPGIRSTRRLFASRISMRLLSARWQRSYARSAAAAGSIL